MKIVSSYDQVVLEEGRQQGLQEGLQQGLLKLIELQLETKYGFIAQSLKERLSTLNANQLENLGGAILTLNSINDVTEWLNEHNIEL